MRALLDVVRLIIKTLTFFHVYGRGDKRIKAEAFRGRLKVNKYKYI